MTTTREPADPRLGLSPARKLPSRLPSLTGARFVAAGLVFLFHSCWQVFWEQTPDPERTSTFPLFFQGGWTGVSFFFVLSGFVLTWAVRPGDDAPTFWRRRFFKIYPNHLLTLIAAAVLLTWVAKTTIDGWDSVLNLLLLQSWDTDIETRISLNPVAWSLSCEALFYFSFPFLIKVIDKVRPERLWFWAILSAGSVVSVPFFATLLPDAEPMPIAGFTLHEMWLLFQFPPVRMLEFVFGIFMAKIVITGRRLPLRLGGATALAIGAYFLTPLFGPTFRLQAVMVVPLGLLIAAGAVADTQRQDTFLGNRLMVWLGDISFAFYMWHNMVLIYGYQWLNGGATWSTTTTVAAVALLFVVTLVLSWATFTFVERPIMKRFATSRRKRGLAAVAAGAPPDRVVR